MALFEEKMRADGMSDAAIAAFKGNFEKLVAGDDGVVHEDDIEAVKDLPRLDALPRDDSIDLESLLNEAAVLKLNGGLGTSMGLEKAKSLLEVKDGKSFLDLIAEQVKHLRATYASKVKFILMNSFSTSDDTKAYLSKSHADLVSEPYFELLQNKSPKVDAKTMEPASFPDDTSLEWCPPGHGDIYPSLYGSGLLDKLLADGVKYLFVSNSDNLGATLDLDLLAYFATSGKAFCMEVCERTAADKKGGHLARFKADGKFMLRESAMCKDADKQYFEDITLHKFFNTNNLWVNLPQLKATLEKSGGALPLPLIKNKKTINPRDSSTPAVFQLETAMGSAIECFDNAGAIVVPRTRFAPVKTCSDLFVLRSDVYKITEMSTVEAVVEKVPLVKLDDGYYKLVDQLQSLTPYIPSMVGATSFTVKGPVKFGSGVVIKGDVTLENPSKSPVEISSVVVENEKKVLQPEVVLTAA